MPSCAPHKWFRPLFVPCRTPAMWRQLAALLAPCTIFPTIVRGSLQSSSLEAFLPWSRCWGKELEELWGSSQQMCSISVPTAKWSITSKKNANKLS